MHDTMLCGLCHTSIGMSRLGRKGCQQENNSCVALCGGPYCIRLNQAWADFIEGKTHCGLFLFHFSIFFLLDIDLNFMLSCFLET